MNHTSWTDYGTLGQLETDDAEVIRLLLTAWLHGVPLVPGDWGCIDDEPALVIVGAVKREHCWRFALARDGEEATHGDIVAFLG